MTTETTRNCEYCDTRFLAGIDADSTERFCSQACRASAWEGGNPNVLAVDAGDGTEFVEYPVAGGQSFV